MGNLNKNFYREYHYNKLEDPSKPRGANYSGPFIHPKLKNFEEIEQRFENSSILSHNIQKMIQFKDKPCLGRRLKIGTNSNKKPIFDSKYTFFTYGEVHTMTENFAKNFHMRKSNLVIEDEYQNHKMELIGIYAKNCIEWIIADMGCQMNSVTTCTLYSTFGSDAFNFICNQTKIKTLIISPDLTDNVCEMKQKYDLENLSKIILFDMTTYCDFNKEKEKLNKVGFEVLSFQNDFLKENKEISDSELILSKPETILTICYTSGTTGNPKGVMLNQKNLRAVIDSVIRDSDVPLDENSVHISYLPLAHIFERMVISAAMSKGVKIGFITGSVRTTLMEDMKLLKPTILFCVPRVLQTIRDKIFDGFDSLPALKKRLAYKAYQTKLENFNKYQTIFHYFYDKLIFNKIRNMFGGNLQIICCSGAPLPRPLANDIKILLSTPIAEGYGMTELSGSAFCTNCYDLSNITQGGVTSSTKIKLENIPELGYTYDNEVDGYICPTGEMCLKGPIVFQGYYKNDEENRKCFDSEGYFHSGDVGRIFPQYGNGLIVIDRKKEIFKLSQGEYIIPIKLESVYTRSRFVTQIMIYGNSNMNNIIAIIQPDEKNCANELRISVDEIKDKKYDNKIKEIMRDDLGKLANESSLNGLERVKYMIITFEGFTIENKCMTPSMKIARKNVQKLFQEDIDKIYENASVKN